MKFIFTGGGTGGHIYPAIALIKAIRKSDPDSEILYIGKINSQEEKIAASEKIAFKGIKINYFHRRFTLKNLKTLYLFLKAYCKARKLIKQFKPDIIIGTGGYVCAPVVYAGARQKIKTIIHEQNSVPGITNKFLARFCDKVAISMPTSKAYFPQEKVVLTGNPRAQEVMETKKVTKADLGLSKDKKLLLIFMGSLGAKYVNEAICKILPELAKRADLETIFVTGKIHFDNIIKEANIYNNQQNIIIKAYVDNMPEYYQHTDLIICRAGATTLAEISAIGIPAVLVPSPYVTNNHQEKNAQALVNQGGAIMIKESELDEKLLVKQIFSLIADPYNLRLMKNKLKKSGIPNSCDLFIELIKSL